MAPIDIVQAQAEEATRRQQLVNAQATLRNNELALKRLIVSGTEDELWRATIDPVGSADRRPPSRSISKRPSQRAAAAAPTCSTAQQEPGSSDISIRSLRERRRCRARTSVGLNLLGGRRRERRGARSRSRNEHRSYLPPAATGRAAARLRLRRADLDDRAELRISDRLHAARRRTSRVSSCCRQQSEAADQDDRAADRDRGDRRGAGRPERARGAAGGAGRARAVRAAASRRPEQDRRRAWRRTSKSSRRSATSPTRATASCAQQLNYQRALVDFQRVQISPR